MRTVHPLPPLAFATALLAVTASLALTGCEGGKNMRPYGVSIAGNPQNGRQIIQNYGCGGCHIIPGVHNARGLVGPPLLYFSERTMIAGELPNTPENLVRWVENPRAVEPNTAMPDLGLSPDQAYDVAAYLYTIR
jgi:cytochrome c2